MATATRKRPKKGEASDAAPPETNGEQRRVYLSIPVKFGKVSIGEAEGSIAVKIDRDCLSLESAADSFCGRRLVGQAIRMQEGEDPRQIRFDSQHHKVEGSFDFKGFRCTAKNIGATLNVSLEDIDKGELVNLANPVVMSVAPAVAPLQGGLAPTLEGNGVRRDAGCVGGLTEFVRRSRHCRLPGGEISCSGRISISTRDRSCSYRNRLYA